MAYTDKYSERSTNYKKKYVSLLRPAQFGISTFGNSRFGDALITYTDKYSKRSTSYTDKYTTRGTNL